MKLLLDENLPKKLKQDFKDFEIYTVAEMEWSGKSNGELLKMILAEKFDVLITFDKNPQHQQNFMKYPITIFVLIARKNTYAFLKNLVESIKAEIKKGIKPGPVEIK